MDPYEQGYLDGLCGIYSVINAIRLILNGMKEDEAMMLFSECMKHVEKRKSLGQVSTEGIDTKDMWSLLKKVVLVKYKIHVEKPFHKTGKMHVDDFIKELRKYFTKEGKRIAIIYISRNDWDHWTVIRSLSKKRMVLFDSSMMKTINISRCVLGKRAKDSLYMISPQDTFFLYEN